MTESFKQYSDVLLDAFAGNPRSSEIISKKKEILDDLMDYYGNNIKNILFLGFSPGMLDIKSIPIYVAEVSKNVETFLSGYGLDYELVDLAQEPAKKFDVIIAVDEYFTFADNDLEQKSKVDLLCSLCNSFIVTTLKDYKNQDFKEKEFSQPIVVRGVDSKKIYFEHYEFDLRDKNFSLGTNYIINDSDVTVIGPFPRRNMYFKQLAKFSLDAGASNFLVHKNLMHKSIIKKNYEHIITIKF
jgi:hypothetical protein